MHRSVPTLLLVLLAGLLAPGCHRKKASPAFLDASERFTRLYGQKLDDAYLDSEMPVIRAELMTVPADSLDAPAAQALLRRIDEGMKRAQESAEKRTKAAALANAPTPDFAFRDEKKPEAQAPAPAKDAGASAAHPTAGMSVDELNKRFSDCFQQAGPIQVTGQGLKDMYVLRDGSFCHEQHPGFDEQIVIADGASIVGIYPKSSVVTTVVDGGAAP